MLYFSSVLSGNIAYFATIQFYFCITNLYVMVTRAVNGIINGEIIIYAVVGLLGCMLGDYIGKLVFDKLDSNKLRYIIYIGMIISGITMFF